MKSNARFKIETDGKYFYPYAKNPKGEWEPIMNYYVVNGLVKSYEHNMCETFERAEFLISLLRGKKDNTKNTKIRKVLKEYD